MRMSSRKKKDGRGRLGVLKETSLAEKDLRKTCSEYKG